MAFLTHFRHAQRHAERSEPKTLRERGAAALEFALIAPLFFLVVFGGFEIGFMFRSHLALQDTARDASRVASVERNEVGADGAILQAIAGRAGDLNGEITRVVIFAADTLTDDIPTACTTNTASTAGCNVYIVTDGDIAAAAAAAAAPGGQETGVTPAMRLPLENLGVYIEYDYQYVTGFFDSITLSSSSVQVVELEL